MGIEITGLDHVQLAIPKGGEERARTYFIGLLGMTEIEKPDVLKPRGGFWLTSGSLSLHIGIEEPFAPAKKAHPAFLTPDLAALAADLRAAGEVFSKAEDLPGLIRGYGADPFGNRIEFIERVEAGP